MGEIKTKEAKTNGSYGSSSKVRQFQYKPYPDITVYELALLLPVFSIAMNGGNIIDFIESLPDEAKRHFRDLID
jgi:hypothetical protein